MKMCLPNDPSIFPTSYRDARMGAGVVMSNVSAWQFGSTMEFPTFLTDAIDKGKAWYQGGDAPYITINTLEGQMRCNINDWIILGVGGDIHTCKPSLFAAVAESCAQIAQDFQNTHAVVNSEFDAGYDGAWNFLAGLIARNIRTLACGGAA